MSERRAAAPSRRLEMRRHFAGLMAGETFDLLEAALLIAAEEYPDMDVRREASRVHILAAEAGRRAQGLANPFARLDAVRAWLYDELGFRGNLHRYNDPRNSYLNEVLNRRLGVPLTLSILHMEAARAAGFAARGVSLPGHFVIRVELEGRSILVDPFNRGRVITEDDCRELISRTTGRASLYHRELLDGTDERGVIARMLQNLKHIHVEQKDYRRALAAVERLLAVRPDDPGELRDRGYIRAHLGLAKPAIADLEHYLAAKPAAPDVESVRGRVTWLKRQISEAN